MSARKPTPGTALLILVLAFFATVCNGCAGKQRADLPPWLTLLTGGASVSGCVDGKVTVGLDGIEAEVNVEACAEIEAGVGSANVKLAEACAEWGAAL